MTNNKTVNVQHAYFGQLKKMIFSFNMTVFHLVNRIFVISQTTYIELPLSKIGKKVIKVQISMMNHYNTVSYTIINANV